MKDSSKDESSSSIRNSRSEIIAVFTLSGRLLSVKRCLRWLEHHRSWPNFLNPTGFLFLVSSDTILLSFLGQGEFHWIPQYRNVCEEPTQFFTQTDSTQFVSSHDLSAQLLLIFLLLISYVSPHNYWNRHKFWNLLIADYWMHWVDSFVKGYSSILWLSRVSGSVCSNLIIFVIFAFPRGTRGIHKPINHSAILQR